MADAPEFPSKEGVIEAWKDGTLGDLLEQQLSVLVGEPFRYIGRASDLVWLGFGPLESAPPRPDPDRRVAHYALHVQCPLRLDIESRAAVGSWDIWEQPDAPGRTPEDFEWDVQGANLFDVQAAELNEMLSRDVPTVIRVRADSQGSLTVDMTNELCLRVFPSVSYRQENWRFFVPSGPHLVVLPEG